MLKLIEEIESCLINNELRCALGMALTLPDICAHIAYPEESNSKTRYINWCKQNLYNQGHLPSHIVDYSIPFEQWDRIRVIDPELCYKLRCAFLHSGNLELNQREDDRFPLFYLQISSTKDCGIYSGRDMKDKQERVVETTIDVRHLTKVLCNAAKEYYASCATKERFCNHHIRIIDVEEEVKNYQDAKKQCSTIQAFKKDIGDFDELSNQAKTLFSMFQSGQSKEVLKLVQSDDKAYISAINELIVGGFLIIPPRKP